MASYKVPQDVEADDKLIGPFSFRQFIYLIIVVMAGVLAWGLSQLFIGLVVIPIPIMIFFGALALPLRKDQPMEIYMAAMVSYFLKPRQRMWDPEGVETLIEITAPKTPEVQRTKDISQLEAQQRLSYLANIVDTGGWAIRGVSGQPGTAINNDIYLEAQGAPDVLDTTTSIAQNFDQMMSQSTSRVHQQAVERMQQATTDSSGTTPSATAPVADPVGIEAVEFNPYPSFRQSIIQPLNDTAHQAKSELVSDSIETSKKTTQSTPPEKKASKNDETANASSDTRLTADIMNLANNPDLSIETIAHEAKRIRKKAEEESDEVIISLR